MTKDNRAVIEYCRYMNETKPLPKRRLVIRDGKVLCPECQVSMCGTDDFYCAFCGGLLKTEIARYEPKDRPIHISMAREQAEKEGEIWE